MKKKTKNLKIFGALLFLSFFVLNVMFVLRADRTTGNISISQLQSSAQGSGDGVTITCDPGDYGQCSVLDTYDCPYPKYGNIYLCDASTMEDYCSAEAEYEDCRYTP